MFRRVKLTSLCDGHGIFYGVLEVLNTWKPFEPSNNCSKLRRVYWVKKNTLKLPLPFLFGFTYICFMANLTFLIYIKTYIYFCLNFTNMKFIFLFFLNLESTVIFVVVFFIAFVYHNNNSTNNAIQLFRMISNMNLIKLLLFNLWTTFTTIRHNFEISLHK